MNTGKESKVSFSSEGKETISERLRNLIGSRSVRAAAQDWGLSFSTLNNYLTRGTEPPLNVALRIAEVEHTSVEWIATGKAKNVVDSSQNRRTETHTEKDALRAAWGVALDLMDNAEAAELLKVIISNGARKIIDMDAQDASFDNIFRTLSPKLKARAIELISAHEDAKKGASPSCTEGKLNDPTHKQAS